MTSWMATEVAEIPAVLARQQVDTHAGYAALGDRCRESATPLVVTCARGSSESAAAFGRALLGLVAGVPAMPLGPSMASVYGAAPASPGSLALAISQSGASPDLLSLMRGLGQRGATTAALVNDTGSPLAHAADVVLPILAGPERAVAAQKTCLASMAALAVLAARWGRDDALEAAIRELPEAAAGALALDWSAVGPLLEGARSVLVIGRGPSLAAAHEMALKIKELLGLHAEAVSSAEVMHGPVALGNLDLAVIALAPADAGRRSTLDAVAALRERGAQVLVAGEALPLSPSPHPWLAPMLMLTSFYAAIELVARCCGSDPDLPFGLHKVTRTV